MNSQRYTCRERHQERLAEADKVIAAGKYLIKRIEEVKQEALSNGISEKEAEKLANRFGANFIM